MIDGAQSPAMKPPNSAEKPLESAENQPMGEAAGHLQTTAASLKSGGGAGIYLFLAGCFVWAGFYCRRGMGVGRSLILGLALLVIAIGFAAFAILASRRKASSQKNQLAPKIPRWVVLAAAGILTVAIGARSVLSGAFVLVFWVPAVLFFSLPCLFRLLELLSPRRDGPGKRQGWSLQTWKMFFWFAVAIHILVSVTIIRMHPGDFTDVYTFQRDCDQALVHGIDPYTISHENIYKADVTARVYAPGIVWGGRVHAGYSYPPAALFFTLPGYLLGDVRYMQIVAIMLSAFLIARIQPNAMAIGVACILLVDPISFGIEMYSNQEAFVLSALALTVYAAVRRSWWLPLALGVFMASKQYVLVAAPFFFFLQPLGWKQNLKLFGKAAAVAICITAPLALWHLHSFIQDTIVLIARIPPHMDSLSLNVLLPVSPLIACGLMLCAIAFCLYAAQRTPAMFAASFGFVLLVFMFVSKQALLNYFYLIAYAFWLSAAAFAAKAPAMAGKLEQTHESAGQ
jgi:hypothetical protein